MGRTCFSLLPLFVPAVLLPRLLQKGEALVYRPPSQLLHWQRHPMSDNLPNLAELSTLIDDDKSFVLRIVQPGLAGLMDGSVSTLAPIFATAFATHNSRTVFLIGAASAVGAGISMAFSEGLSDDGELTGRGNPVFRGIVTGLMTFIGGFLHTLPFLIPNVHTALTWAYAVVGVELVVIALIRHRYFKTSFALSCLQVIVGGGLVFAAGVLIGQS
jgi:erythrin-vacuolar iron transport family protein